MSISVAGDQAILPSNVIRRTDPLKYNCRNAGTTISFSFNYSINELSYID